jgi:Tol biopolymer transport system component
MQINATPRNLSRPADLRGLQDDHRGFADDRDSNLLADSRPNRYLGSPGRPSWSADGERVAVRLNRQAVVVERDTREVSLQLGDENSNIGAPQFSPDGTRLAYDTYTQTPGGKKQWAIQIADAHGESPRFVVDHGRHPQWSPDGEKLAFSSYTDDFQTKVSTVNADGTDEKEVSQLPHATDFDWSPDGKLIAYEAGATSGYELRTVDVENGVEKVLSDGDGGVFWDRSPTFSPRGQTIVFERRYKQFPAASLWTVETQTGREKLLLNEFADVVDPIYSPDGKSLVFGSNHGGRGGLDLFRMDLQDLSLTQLTDQPGDEHSPSFSPNGESLAYFNSDRNRPSGQRQQLHFTELGS